MSQLAWTVCGGSSRCDGRPRPSPCGDVTGATGLKVTSRRCVGDVTSDERHGLEGHSAGDESSHLLRYGLALLGLTARPAHALDRGPGHNLPTGQARSGQVRGGRRVSTATVAQVRNVS